VKTAGFSKQENGSVNRIHPDHLIGLACIVLAATIYWVSDGFPKLTTGASDLTGPSFYPRLLALVLVPCGILQIISGFKHTAAGQGLNHARLREGWSGPGARNILIVCGLILFFIYTLEYLGFFITTPVVLIALMWRFGVPWKRNLLYSVVLVTLIYLIFGKLFTIYLPTGVLEQLGL
jgi:putative tricarboxylic transport membrane protein